LGLEYSTDELRSGLRNGPLPGLVDAVANFVPGFVAGSLLGWETAAAILLGGVCWVSSSGIVSKVLADLDRLGNRETPAILNLLVVEDLAMAVFLPVASALATGDDLTTAAITIGVALSAVMVIVVAAIRYGKHLSTALTGGSDESLLLAVFGLALLVGGVVEQLGVSAAIGAFLVGLALSGSVQERAGALIGPLRDLFAAVFFLFFSFQIRPHDLLGALVPATALAAFALGSKMLSGWVAGAAAGVARPGRLRAGATLMARGEFSIVIASIGAPIRDDADLGALAAAFVLLTAITGPLAARFVGAPLDRVDAPTRRIAVDPPDGLRRPRDCTRWPLRGRRGDH
jgi:CPA2 family monovalent cation:H+ antiporter-2